MVCPTRGRPLRHVFLQVLCRSVHPALTTVNYVSPAETRALVARGSGGPAPPAVPAPPCGRLRQAALCRPGGGRWWPAGCRVSIGPFLLTGYGGRAGVLLIRSNSVVPVAQARVPVICQWFRVTRLNVLRRSWSRAWLASALLLEVATCSDDPESPWALVGGADVGAGVVLFLRSTLPRCSPTLEISNLLVCSLMRLRFFIFFFLGMGFEFLSDPGIV